MCSLFIMQSLCGSIRSSLVSSSYSHLISYHRIVCIENNDPHHGICYDGWMWVDVNSPWLGSCVGAGNYRSFMLFLTFLHHLTWMVVGACIYHLWYKVDQRMNSHKDTSDQAFYAVINTQDVTSFILPIYGLLASLFVTSLYAFHLYLIFIGQTTNERLKESYPYGSPYHTNIFRAFINLCWRPQSRSRLAHGRKVNSHTHLPLDNSSSFFAGTRHPTEVLHPDRYWLTPLAAAHRYHGIKTGSKQLDISQVQAGLYTISLSTPAEMSRREHTWRNKVQEIKERNKKEQKGNTSFIPYLSNPSNAAASVGIHPSSTFATTTTTRRDPQPTFTTIVAVGGAHSPMNKASNNTAALSVDKNAHNGILAASSPHARSHVPASTGGYPTKYDPDALVDPALIPADETNNNNEQHVAVPVSDPQDSDPEQSHSRARDDRHDQASGDSDSEQEHMQAHNHDENQAEHDDDNDDEEVDTDDIRLPAMHSDPTAELDPSDQHQMKGDENQQGPNMHQEQP